MRLRLGPALLLALATIVVGSNATPAHVTAADSDVAGAELMRLTNLDRQALGLQALMVDPTLASIARNRPFTCPSNPGLILAGRAQDMASRDYFAHEIADCGSTVLDVLASEFGYQTWRGENIAWNGYGAGTMTYSVGCDLDGSNCAGTSVGTLPTVAVAERGFMNSAPHRANILGNYDRFGCGSAVSSDGRTYFACLFSLGGPATLTLAAPAISSAAGRVDSVPPHFVVISGVARVLSAGRGIPERATVGDNAALRQVSFWVDGRAIHAWAISATLATRSFFLPAAAIPHGTHVLGWAIRDAAGHTRRTSWILAVN